MALRLMSPPGVPALHSGKSARVTTALTPGSFSAAEVSIDLMIACACGLRKILPTSMPGRNRSAPNLARPVTLSIPSCLTGEVPTIFSFLSGLKPLLSRIVDMSGPSHFLGGRQHRTDDLVVSGAPAQIAGEPVAHLGFGRVGIALEQRLGGDQDAGRTDAALQSVELEEVALQRMQVLALGHAFDGFDRLAV